MAKIGSLKTEAKITNQNKIAEVSEFLSRNYDIRVNQFDPNPNDFMPDGRYEKEVQYYGYNQF